MALRAVPDHPKFANLKSALGQPKGAVMGWLEAIWHFTGRFTPQGNIGKYSVEAIEAWVEWNGEPGALIEALVRTGWLDRDPVYVLLVHDWAEHADKATKNALKRAGQTFYHQSVRTPSVQRTDGLSISGNMSRLPVPEPEPVPEPVPEPESAVNGAGYASISADLSVLARCLSEELGIFDIREQEAVHRFLKAKGNGNAAELIEHVKARWKEYQEAIPRLAYSNGSAHKWLMSGKWDNPQAWPWIQTKQSQRDKQWDDFMNGGAEQ